MRIYFGREPEVESVKNLDSELLWYLYNNDYNMERAVDALVRYLLTNWDEDDLKDVVCHTLNPLIVNYFTDDFAKEYLWIIDEEGNHINMGADESMLEKLTVLGPGEVVCDDYRTFKE